MSKIAKPIVVILLAIGAAAAAGLFLMRKQPETAQTGKSPAGYELDAGGGHFKGPENAKVTLVEFGDYQCPNCGFYHPIVNELLRRFPQDLRLEFHHYPLISIHPYAMQAAMAAEAAGEQGRYWEMHDLLFEHQQSWSQSRNPEPEFLAFATQLGLNANAFMQAMRSPDLQQRIIADVVRARDAKVDEVAAFFIKGRRLPKPKSVDEFSQIIQAELKANP